MAQLRMSPAMGCSLWKGLYMLRLLRRKTEVTLDPHCKHQILQRACLATMWWVSTKATAVGELHALDFCRTQVVADWHHWIGIVPGFEVSNSRRLAFWAQRRREVFRCRRPNRKPQSFPNFVEAVHTLGFRLSAERGREAAAWLSEVLGRPCRLLRRFAGCRRPGNRILRWFEGIPGYRVEGRIRALGMLASGLNSAPEASDVTRNPWKRSRGGSWTW